MRTPQLLKRKPHFLLNQKVRIIFFVFMVFGISNLKALVPDTVNNKVQVDEWLTTGAVEVLLPAFYNEKNLDGKVFKAENLLQTELKKIEYPEDGAVFLERNNNTIQWKKQKTNKDGELVIPQLQNTDYALNWQATYLQCDNYTKLTFEIETSQGFVMFVDGQRKLSKLTFEKNGKAAVKKTKELKLEKGKHLLVIVSLFSKKEDVNWKLQTNIISEDAKNLHLNLDSKQFMNMKLLLEGQQLQGASLSPDGEYVMLRYKEVFSPSGKAEYWLEVHDRKNRDVIFTSRGRIMNQAKWAPVGHQISFVSKFAGKQTLELLDIDDFKNTILLQSQKDFNMHTWAKDGSFIIYSISEEPKEKKKSVYKIEEIPDRWPWWRKRAQLFKLTLKDLSVQQLTYGYLSNNLHDISPDGKRILVSHEYPDYTERPYSKQVLMEINLTDLSVDTIWEKNYGGSATYSPNGKKLLVTGSPVLFGEKGINVSDNRIPNDYDTQAYIYYLGTGYASPITKNFNPAIVQAKWNANDRLIYFIGQDRTYRKVYVFNPKTKTIEDMNAKVDVVKTMDFANKNATMVYTGNSISYPSVCYDYELETKQQSEIADPEASLFENVEFGKTEDWNFKNKSGVLIEGRIYYPPDFNPDKKYPLIVYYYGGTSPTDRSFGGRYPKNLFAAMGFVVYNLQPSGATGYGQEFSAKHVNDWGVIVADEIISGTKLFLDDHTFIDPEKVGCLGASYGGFMTMLLTTQTDIFAAAISHAGISSISSYWGEGFWGYSYSAVASANSFPWNNRKLYVEQSPLFHADKVTTPLLLLHGDADTNVPTGESIQMYTALKLLGKEVELIEVENQDHHITDYKKRILWQKTILAWFDKWLKGDSSWWDTLYPEKNL